MWDMWDNSHKSWLHMDMTELANCWTWAVHCLHSRWQHWLLPMGHVPSGHRLHKHSSEKKVGKKPSAIWKLPGSPITPCAPLCCILYILFCFKYLQMEKVFWFFPQVHQIQLRSAACVHPVVTCKQSVPTFSTSAKWSNNHVKPCQTWPA